jgi:hypothetical protein
MKGQRTKDKDKPIMLTALVIFTAWLFIGFPVSRSLPL